MAETLMSMKVTKRTGEVVDFDSTRVSIAISKAVSAVSAPVTQELVDEITQDIVHEVSERFVDFYPNVENVQDIVEKHLVKKELYEVAKAYILYRAKRQKARDDKKKQDMEKILLGKLKVKKRDGRTVLFDIYKIKISVMRAIKGHEDVINVDLITKEVVKNIYDGIKTEEIERALVMAATSFIEKDPAYGYVASNFFLQKIYKETIGKSIDPEILDILYKDAFVKGIKKSVELQLLDKKILEFDLVQMSESLKLDRDGLFQYMGIQTLYERYFIKDKNIRLELPQAFWMRVAMGLAINEKDREKRAVEFYEMLSTLRFVSSTPTLFHSGTTHPQLSSCYLTTVFDDLSHIFKCIGDNAQLSKWSGGLGNDWTNIRATGSWIKSTNVESQGVVPFLKIANDVTMAINRSGKRRGATCAYLETWHLDIEDFLDLRKNTGDERRRTHDMNTANWIPDLFMKRVINDELWTLFSPEEVPELHHIYGKAFEKKYREYEEKAQEGGIRKHKVMPARQLWKKMLSMLFETGHPWITFKDPCNIRSPQDHVGVIHSSNLCTEITLNTSEEETAVCNLGSINLTEHIVDGMLDEDLLAQTVRTAIRMLDNVIDINYYPTIEARNSNFRHRPIGLGIMGLQDAFFKMNLAFESAPAYVFSDRAMEFISYYAILASSELARERGPYESYAGSKWERGIFPLDTLTLLEDERSMKIDVPRTEAMDWSYVREHVHDYGMRNSNTMAIAPTATIANIAGCYPSIEPIYKNIYVKANISGEFTIVNSYLVEDLKRLEMWNDEMLDKIKYYDGNIEMIPGIPEQLKQKYKGVFELDTEVLLKHAALRGKWIDQSQSLNLFLKTPSGKLINDMYVHAWKMGLKTTYYLRSLSATQIEKSTLDANKFGFTQKREYGIAAIATAIAASGQSHQEEGNGLSNSAAIIMDDGQKLCKIDDPDCEACQ